MTRVTSNKVPWSERFIFIFLSMLLALLDISVIYFAVDIAMKQELNWAMLLLGWWVLQIVHTLDYVSDYKNGV